MPSSHTHTHTQRRERERERDCHTSLCNSEIGSGVLFSPVAGSPLCVCRLSPTPLPTFVFLNFLGLYTFSVCVCMCLPLCHAPSCVYHNWHVPFPLVKLCLSLDSHANANCNNFPFTYTNLSKDKKQLNTDLFQPYIPPGRVRAKLSYVLRVATIWPGHLSLLTTVLIFCIVFYLVLYCK